jgi:nucleoside-diphosphate-sugar epimerase
VEAGGPQAGMSRILVTGASGFLGASVVRRLHADGHEVTGLAFRSSGEHGYLRGDLADPAVAAALLAPWRWDVVIDLAGPVTSGAEDLPTGIQVVADRTNIALNIRRYAGAARIVHASSMTVYGNPERVDVEEDHPRRPLHLYGLAKRVAEDVYLAANNLDAWVLRLPGLFSERRRNGALFHFCRAARAREPLLVQATTPVAWNVLHVEDAAEVLVRAVSAPGHAAGALNISYDEPIDLVSVAKLIADITKTGAPVQNTTGVEHPRFRLVATKAAHVLHWQPPSLRERLEALYEAYAAA